MFQHTAARRRLRHLGYYRLLVGHVSTHSRAEAAAEYEVKFGKQDPSFNTQPRGGGCIHLAKSLI